VCLLQCLSSQGITSGAHRLWSHRSYKATLPLRCFLCFCQTIAFQNDVYEWARDHRVHHKYTDSNADPHNASRGFFFSHMGWLLVRKHPDVISKGKTVDMSDLEADPVLMFQRKYYLILAPLCSFVLPAVIPWYCWGEDFYVSWCYATMLRYLISLHFTWLVNSAAHMWGTKPYDRYSFSTIRCRVLECDFRNIKPAENILVSYLTMGEGWHNYHHTFPWDYKAAELDKYSGNLSTAFIDLMAKIGWAYDLKTVSPDMVKRRMRRTGTATTKADSKEYQQEDRPLFIERYCDSRNEKQLS
jgi:stearoyl-CoA desaturase (delta-9 desaturase)